MMALLTLTFKRDVEGVWVLVNFDQDKLWFLRTWDSLDDVMSRVSGLATDVQQNEFGGFLVVILSIYIGEQEWATYTS
jgi:hypothetical protein